MLDIKENVVKIQAILDKTAQSLTEQASACVSKLGCCMNMIYDKHCAFGWAVRHAGVPVDHLFFKAYGGVSCTSDKLIDTKWEWIRHEHISGLWVMLQQMHDASVVNWSEDERTDVQVRENMCKYLHSLRVRYPMLNFDKFEEYIKKTEITRYAND